MAKIEKSDIRKRSKAFIDTVLASGYGRFIRSQPKKNIKSSLSLCAEADEILNPAMALPLLLTFETYPVAATEKLYEREGEDKVYVARLIVDFLELAEEWVIANEILLNELIAYVDGAYSETLEDGFRLISNLDITTSIEKMYIEDSATPKDKQNRIKLLSWLMAKNASSLISKSLHRNAASMTLVATSIFFRAMLQFSAGKTIKDGLALHKGRGMPSVRDKTGYRALKKKYMELYPKISNAMIWKYIRRDTSESNPFHHDEYEVYFHENTRLSGKVTDGVLVQRKGENKPSSIGFESFRKIKI